MDVAREVARGLRATAPAGQELPRLRGARGRRDGDRPVVRALDDAGLHVASLDLVEPTLDDVFVEKTGSHLEGTDEVAPEQDPIATPG